MMPHLQSTSSRPITRGTRRRLFLPDLRYTLRAFLPDARLPSDFDTTRWLTVRVRPEITAAVAALQARYKAHRGVTLTFSEVAAAALVAGIPKLVLNGDFDAGAEGDDDGDGRTALG